MLTFTLPPRRHHEAHALADEYADAARDGRIPALSASLMAKAMLIRAVAIRVDENGWPMTHSETEEIVRLSWK